VSGTSAVVGVARIAADRDQADICRARVAVFTAATAVTAVAVPAVVPRTPTAVTAVVPRAPAASAGIGNADIAVAIATNALETEAAAVIATGVVAAAIAIKKIPKVIAEATTTTAKTVVGRSRGIAATVVGRSRGIAATTVRETARITSIAHSISILLVYLRINLIVQYMIGRVFSCIYVTPPRNFSAAASII
jgi:hypothetical protein